MSDIAPFVKMRPEGLWKNYALTEIAAPVTYNIVINERVQNFWFYGIFKAEVAGSFGMDRSRI